METGLLCEPAASIHTREDTRSELTVWSPDTSYASHLCPACPGPESTRNLCFAQQHVAPWQRISLLENTPE